MISRFLNLLSNNKYADTQKIRDLPSLHDLIKCIDENLPSIDKGGLNAKIKRYKHLSKQDENVDIFQSLNALFDMLTSLLKYSVSDAELASNWRLVLRELLVKIPFTGKQMETANKIRNDLDNDRDLLLSTRQSKSLLLDYASKAHDNQKEVQEFLKNISIKLQNIYTEINEARESCSHSSRSKSDLRSSFAHGMQQLKSSLDSSEDIDSLKSSVNQLVDALQDKVEKELEQDESETQILESKILGLSNKVKSLENHAQDLERTIREKHEESITDPLTGLYNRAAYVQALEKAWMNWKESNEQATLLVWDIDHFKMLNDRYGHAAGDKVLQSVANKLKNSLEGDDIVARFGGEEFVMLLYNKSVKEGKQLAEKTRALIAATEFSYKHQPMQVTISCGVAEFVKNDTPTTLFERADKALYKAKRTGRNKVEVFAKVA